MNVEKNISTVDENVITLKASEVKEKVFPARVDINHIFARARKKKQKENLTNLVFFSLFAALFVVSGILLSL